MDKNKEKKIKEDLLPDETLSNKLISKWFWLYFFVILWLPLWYIIRVIISNDLSVSEVWIIYGMISLMWLLSAISWLWLSSWSLIYFLPKYIVEKNKDYTNTIYKIVRYINILMTLIVSIWLYFFIKHLWVNYLNHPETNNILYIFLLLFIFTNLANPIIWIFQTIQNVFLQQLSGFISQFIITIWVVSIFVLWIWNILGYSMMFLIWAIISYSILYISYKLKYSKQIESNIIKKDSDLFKKMIKFWLNSFIWANAMMFIVNMDMQMILAISGTTEAWYYSNYMSLIAISMIFLSPIIGLLFPITSEFHNKNNYQKLRLLISFLYKYILIFSISVCMLLLVFWEVLAVVLFWEDFLYSGTILNYLALFAIFQLIFSINLSFIWWIGKNYINRNILMIALIINILLNLVFIYFYWAFWAWIATWITWTFIALSSFYFVCKYIWIDFDRLFLVKNIILIAVIWIIYYLIIPDIFILENIYRYVNFVYLLLMWFWAYLVFLLFNTKEYKYFMSEVRSFRRKIN